MLRWDAGVERGGVGVEARPGWGALLVVLLLTPPHYVHRAPCAVSSPPLRRLYQYAAHLGRGRVLLLALASLLLELLVEGGRLGDLGLAHLVRR